MYVADGFAEYSTVPLSAVRIELPCDEEAFDSGQSYDTGHLDLTTFEVTTPWVAPPMRPRTASYSVAQYARQKGDNVLLPWQTDSPAEKCQAALEWWKLNLGPELQLENRTIPLPESEAELTAILALHLWHNVSYLDLGRLTIYTFVESVSPDILSTAPEWYVRQAQDQCVERAGKILELCNLVLDLRPSFIPHDPYIAAPMYSAIRSGELSAGYRFGAPSEKSFAYAGSILNDLFALLKRYGLADIMASRVPLDIAAELAEHNLPIIQRPAKPPAYQDISMCPSKAPSPEPEPLGPMSLTPDQAQTELFRPPFHSAKDTHMVSPSADSTNTVHSVDDSLWPVPATNNLPDQNASLFPLAGADTSLQVPSTVLGPNIMAAGPNTLAQDWGSLNPSALFSISPGMFQPDAAGEVDIWSLFGDFGSVTNNLPQGG
ncbi:hypothetical protein EHS25_008129 [Saitozyma podzolica]|uniref:Transcription factor domain-containing protein n=1 Tax=Saitozyma podzolica TaxID=1890683 RepID=A0A427YNK1_9TREE|nr:hypothetical protein EHS25_008129 [Saitozyma podzolica]